MIIKMLILGNTGVGKTSLAIRLVDGVFPNPERLLTTIGVAFYTKKIDDELSLQIWDFGGQEHFRSMTQNLYSGGRMGLLVFDVTSKLTLDDLENFWIKNTNEQLGNILPAKSKEESTFLLVANKVDISEMSKFTDDEIQAFADKYNIDWIKVSAKSGEGIVELDNKIKEIAMKFKQ